MSAAEDFGDSKFKAECSNITLTLIGDPNLTVNGAGEIWQDENGLIQYKIFTNESGFERIQKYLSTPKKRGMLIPEDSFFRLEAQDYSNARWSASWVYPGIRGALNHGIIYGSLNELKCISTFPFHPKRDAVVLRFKGKLNIPCNKTTETVVRVGGQDRRRSQSLDSAFIDHEDYHFEVEGIKEHTKVSLELPIGKLTSVTPYRILESLQFILGRQLSLMVIEMTTNGQDEVRLLTPPRGHGQVPPPLQYNLFQNGDHVWRLFMDYFLFIHTYQEPGWHPISRYIGSTIEASAASLDTLVLALSVAVEGLSSHCFKDLVLIDERFLNEIAEVELAVKKLDVSDTAKSRISGSLSGFKKPRNTDFLHEFIKANNLNADFFDAWKRLRHHSAHGGTSGNREIAETIQLRDSVLTLLYSLVFGAINYKGPRTDYSQHGWPQVLWPPDLNTSVK